jgi:hypothetical protein
MEAMAADCAETILADFRRSGWDSQPEERAVRLALARPAEAGRLVELGMAELPKGATFLDAILSFVDADAYPRLVAAALERLSSGLPNATADAVFSYGSLMFPAALHPHLDEIFLLRPNEGTYYEAWPWRESGTAHLPFLRGALEGGGSDLETRRRAWSCLLETRDPECIEVALAGEALCGLPYSGGIGLLEVGLQRSESGLRRLFSERVLHLAFPHEYIVRPGMRFPLQRRYHPTWGLNPASGPPMRFGGPGEGSCGVCGGTLHHFLTLDPVPSGLGGDALGRLVLEACGSCVQSHEALFYRHDGAGRPETVGHDGPLEPPESPGEPLVETRVRLAATPARWRWQDWALSNGRENLFRLGGFPCWIQSAQHEWCPLCHQPMPLLMQLDSDLPTEGGGEAAWGDYGLLYVLWCDACRVSGWCLQCT